VRESEHSRSTGVLSQDRIYLDPDRSPYARKDRLNNLRREFSGNQGLAEYETPEQEPTQASKDGVPKSYSDAEGNTEDGANGNKLGVRSKGLPTINEFNEREQRERYRERHQQHRLNPTVHGLL